MFREGRRLVQKHPVRLGPNGFGPQPFNGEAREKLS